MENKKENMRKLIERLERIAKVNNDKFSYNINVELNSKSGLRYTFTATEITDNHDFIVVQSNNLITLVDMANEEIEEVCEAWGYKCV
jgi:hypothetical protein